MRGVELRLHSPVMLPIWNQKQHFSFGPRKNRAMQKPPTQRTTQDTFVQTAVRLPRALHSDIKNSAEANGRSQNAEIIARLQTSTTIDQTVLKELADLKKMVRTLLEK